VADTPEARKRRRANYRKGMTLSKEMASIIKFIPKGVSPVRVALNYAKMLRVKGFQPTGLMGINPTMFKNEAACRTAVLLLRNNGLVAQSDNGMWHITTRGELAIQLLQIREPSIHEPSGGDTY
jgi:hypothetical protein